MREMICSIFASKKAKMFFQKTKVQWVTCLLCTFPRRSMTSLSKWLLFPVIISWVHIAFSWPIYYYSYKWHHEDWSSPKKTQTREVDEMKMKKKCSAICLISGSLPFSLYLSLPLSPFPPQNFQTGSIMCAQVIVVCSDPISPFFIQCSLTLAP